ncbi:hypothetical protein GCM10023339_76910 [Alloalcanivorax gelatiniphagus]
MSPKRPYQKRLPRVLPPAPRAAPDQESLTPSVEPRASAPPAPPAPPVERTLPDRGPEPRPPRTPAPAYADPDERGARPRRTAAALALLAVAALVVAGLVMWRVGGGAPDDDLATTSSAPGWPAEGASRTVTQVRPDGVLRVTHRIHSAEPLDQLDLALPQLAPGMLVEASAVEVTADDQPASGPDVVTTTPSTYFFPDATRILVRYELTGAVARSTSVLGRGLVTTTALEVSAQQPQDIRVVRATAVLSLACAPPGSQAPAPCGEADAEGQWHVELIGADAGSRVVAQVDLP